jgi:UDP-N-acetylmuramoyl-L-alanyl-D-glutamate--2,6-diaminopimelate ligase
MVDYQDNRSGVASTGSPSVTATPQRSVKRLADLIATLGGPAEFRGADLPIAGLAYDSRAVQPGDLFIALQGQRADGHTFVTHAIHAGAAAVVVADPAPAPPRVPVVVVRQTRRALAELACAFFDHPSRKLRLIGVTGTDGKTTTAHMIAHLLRSAGRRVGLLSTVQVMIDGVVEPNSFNYTTPQPPELQATLARMIAAGVEDAVIEVSSHALALDRLAGCTFAAAVFTNLAPEHLDFHGTLDDYRAAKARLFRMIDWPPAPGGFQSPFGVVNADDPSAMAMAAACRAPVVRAGVRGDADVHAAAIRRTASGTSFEVHAPQGRFAVETALRGDYNVANWLAALAVALRLGISPQEARAAAATFPGVPGRWQHVEVGQPFTVIVDFAHTPQALDQVLREARVRTSGRVIIVFGHAGRRCRPNRPALGEVAGRLADVAIVTTDDAYDEDPAAIIAEVAEGLRRAGRRAGEEYHCVVDRRAGMELAFRLARAGDTVVIAGRGHEQFTTCGAMCIPFDDVAVARALLCERW